MYGPREGHKGSMASVAFHLNNQTLKGENPKLFAGSEHFRRDFVYVGDVGTSYYLVLAKWHFGNLQCGNWQCRIFCGSGKAVIKSMVKVQWKLFHSQSI